MTGFGRARKAKRASKARSSALKLDAQINRINREKLELGVKYFQQGELSRAKELVEDATKTDEESSGFSASYTMGSMTLGAVANKTDSISGTSGTDYTFTEVSLAFAF